MKPWTRAHTQKSIAELRKDIKLPVDTETFEIIKESVKRAYGFDWPTGVGFEEGCRLLFEERMAYWNDWLRRRNDEQETGRPT